MKNEADLLVKHTEGEAARARARFMATLGELRQRLDPRVIATETAENLVGRASQLLDDTKTSVNRRPVLSFAGVAAFVVAVGLRIWLSRTKTESDAT